MTPRAVQGPDRSVPPEALEARPFRFPPVASTTLGNGLGIRTARMPRLPLVTVALVLDAGEGTLPPEKAGLALLTGNALHGGAAGRSAAELAEAVEGIGTSLSVSTTWDATTLSLTCLADRLQEAMTIMGEVAREPSFPEDQVDRHRSQLLAAIRQRAMDPGSRADDAAAEHVYREGARYATPLPGTERTVGECGREEVGRFGGARYAPEGSGLVVVGDVLPDDALELAERSLGGWRGAAAVGPVPPPTPRYSERRVIVVDRPGSVQSEVRVGQVGVPRASPDYFPLVVFNTILGGAFTSRLNLNLRETHGFTYGVRSRFGFRRLAGPFLVSTAVGTEVTADAVRETLTEIEKLVAEGPTNEEVAAATEFIAGVFPLGLESTDQVAARVADMIVHELPEDYPHTYRDRIRAVSPAGAWEAGAKHLLPERLTVLVVGDAASVAEPLRGLGIGPTTVVSDG